jgi:hypothetical protein
VCEMTSNHGGGGIYRVVGLKFKIFRIFFFKFLSHNSKKTA